MSLCVEEAVRGCVLMGASVAMLVAACAIDAVEWMLGLQPAPASEDWL